MPLVCLRGVVTDCGLLALVSNVRVVMRVLLLLLHFQNVLLCYLFNLVGDLHVKLRTGNYLYALLVQVTIVFYNWDTIGVVAQVKLLIDFAISNAEQKVLF